MAMQGKQVWTVQEVLGWAAGDFRERGIPRPRLEAEVLLAHALGKDRLWLYTSHDAPLNPDERGRFRDLVLRRRNGEPAAYLTGAREFWSRRFEVTPAVLIPRPETETLVSTALRELGSKGTPRILDVGTGSGILAITLALEIPAATVVATDLSAEALEVARQNAVRLGASERITFLCGDRFAPLDRRPEPFDAIVSNPPYIPTADLDRLDPGVRDFEPRVALDGGPDGLGLIASLVEEASRHLVAEGLFAFEIGAGQAEDVRARMDRTGAWRDLRFEPDLAGIERVAVARRAAP